MISVIGTGFRTGFFAQTWKCQGNSFIYIYIRALRVTSRLPATFGFIAGATNWWVKSKMPNSTFAGVYFKREEHNVVNGIFYFFLLEIRRYFPKTFRIEKNIKILCVYKRLEYYNHVRVFSIIGIASNIFVYVRFITDVLLFRTCFGIYIYIWKYDVSPISV